MWISSLPMRKRTRYPGSRDTGLFEGGVGSRFLGRCYFDLVHREQTGASQHVLAETLRAGALGPRDNLR
jgi:hypothetical protein